MTFMAGLIIFTVATSAYAGDLQKVHTAANKRSDSQSPIYFSTDIIPILTKLGCNSGGCHGKSTGQNGFKISLLGFEPHQDYSALVNEARGRRIFPGDPSQSLLLLKAVGRVPHGGGKRLEVDSEDYRVLFDWIARGALGPQTGDPNLLRVTLSPQTGVLEPGIEQQLVATAHFSDGSDLDVSNRAIYETNEPEIAEVNRSGLIRTHQKSGGLFAVMVRFGDQISVFQGEVPFHSRKPGSQVSNNQISKSELTKIDHHLVAQWRRLGIEPSSTVVDEAFIRRVTIDICGTLPTVEEINSYIADQHPDKRDRLIDRLLERPEYASYFAMKWAGILQNRGRGYSTRKQRAGTALFSAWIRDSITSNMPYDRFVSEIITATGSQDQNPPTIWYRSIRTTQDYVESIAQAFLGVRIQCAQCHHHPAERWSQSDYYGLAAVFARVGRKGGFTDAEVPTNEIIYLKQHGEVVHPRNGQVMVPRPLGGPDFELTPFDDPRRSLAKWMISPDNSFLVQTMVNRMWGHFFGRGIIHPIDDARSSNPPSNPELLAELTRDFINHEFDVKHLIRTITRSYAYRLSSSPNESNLEDIQSFARFYPRRLQAEVLLDGFSQVLEVPTIFPGGPGIFPAGTRAIELPDENVPVNFLDVFGRPARTSACECERTDSPALAQALELVNSSEIQRKLTDKTGYVEQLGTNEKPHSVNVRELFMKTFSRLPTAGEANTATQFLETEPDRTEAYRSLLWSLLATNEFLFNH